MAHPAGQHTLMSWRFVASNESNPEQQSSIRGSKPGHKSPSRVILQSKEMSCHRDDDYRRLKIEWWRRPSEQRSPDETIEKNFRWRAAGLASIGTSYYNVVVWRLRDSPSVVIAGVRRGTNLTSFTTAVRVADRIAMAVP